MSISTYVVYRAESTPSTATCTPTVHYQLTGTDARRRPRRWRAVLRSRSGWSSAAIRNIVGPLVRRDGPGAVVAFLLGVRPQ